MQRAATGLRRRVHRIVRLHRPRFRSGRDPAYLAWVRTLDCVLWRAGECRGRIEACHVQSRGAGGVDRGNTYPGCTRHHRQQHTLGIRSFQERHGLDLVARAAELAEVYAAPCAERLVNVDNEERSR